MSLSSYLAQKYLTAEKSSSKKRKRKNPQGADGLIIADDDALGWSNATTPGEGTEDDGRPVTVTSGSAEFRKAKKSGWKTVGVPALEPTLNGNDDVDDDDAREAERIINETAAENAAAGGEDNGPVIEDGGEEILKMNDGTHAGLQRAKDVGEQFERRKREEEAAWAREGGKSRGKDAETVYRDATGRRIDLSMRRQEARRELDEKARKEREELDAQKGDAQLAARQKRREELDEARFMTVARKADDEDMNRELKEVERWNDPAMQFLAKKKAGKSVSGKPLYQGASAPNRYGIRPGHKWDGVDRSNGWEGERFKALNRTARNKDLDFQWQMDE